MTDNCSLCARDGMLYNLDTFDEDGKTYCDDCMPPATICRDCKGKFDPDDLNYQQRCSGCHARHEARWKAHKLVLAAQAVCQSRNGSDPVATKAQHEIDVDELTKALDEYHS